MKFTQAFSLILSLLYFCCCNSTSTKNPEAISTNKIDSINNIDTSCCQPFYVFDEVSHFSIKINDTDLDLLIRRVKKNPKDSLLLKVFTSSRVFQSIEDTTKIIDLERIGYKKVTLNKKFNDTLNNIFFERRYDSIVDYSCVPRYRDIFVFKNLGRTVGIAQLCYSCFQKNFVGTTQQTYGFGFLGEFDALQKITSNRYGL